jgi:dimethylamine/trimethylamine dehydrogenase
MSRAERVEPRYQILFQPLPIGPVTAPNRFYQVPHCTGMGFRMPQTLAAMRETKAEGGWGVVCTEYCSIHPSSDDSPLPYAALWDEDDLRAQALMVEKVHRHGALAGIQLWHGGGSSSNLYTRETPIGPQSRPFGGRDPVQCRAMDRRDIRELRRWQVDAARRAQRAGFDIVYVYATHDYLLAQFLSPDNDRADEYGGSLQNRVRLLREMIEDTKQAIGDRCAVAVRLAADAGWLDAKPDTEEQREIIAMLADLPDLWDINVRDYSYEMGSSRFVKEAALEEYVRYVKQITGKPVVSVGRFSSPDTMVRQVQQGLLDLIGCARPSIADPFLPRKIREGRLDDIRECIGCNICFSCDSRSVPLVCTQNPAMGEEWRRGWHPEYLPPKGSDRNVLVVGGGPAGLEAARALGQRGYRVTLAEASRELGGRVWWESSLPGLAEWSRVRDWRIGQLAKMPNVEVYRESYVDADQILEFRSDRVALATGSEWRRDGVGSFHGRPIPGWRDASVLTPDDIAKGAAPEGPILVFDDDHYYLGGVLAEKLAVAGREVRLVTPMSLASNWTRHTDEQHRIQARLIEVGVQIEANTVLETLEGQEAVLACTFTWRTRRVEAAQILMVTARIPRDALYHQLVDRVDIARIGDCLAPGTIAACVRSGHRYAREMDASPLPFRRENPTTPREPDRGAEA